MALNYLLDPMFQIENSAGKPATDGWLEVYIHGTRTKYYCASNFDGTLHPFKIKLDSLGSNIVLADDGQSYDVYAYNRFGSLLMSRYNVQPGSGGGGSVITGQMQHWMGMYGPTYTHFPGDNAGHTLGIPRQSVEYDGDFIDRIENTSYPDGDVPAYIYLKPGLYHIDCVIRYQQDTGDIKNTLDEVLVYTGHGNANEDVAYQLDASGPETNSNRHCLKQSFIRKVTDSDGEVLYFAPGTPTDWTDAYIQTLSIVKLDSVAHDIGLQEVYHDDSMTGKGTPDEPLSIQDALDGKQDTLTAGEGIILDSDGNISVDTDVIQEKLTAGDNITIDSDGVISTEGRKYTEGWGIDVDNDNNVISADPDEVQRKLTAGENITIDSDGVISAAGGENNVFIAEVGTTPYDDIKAAVDAGKVVIARLNRIQMGIVSDWTDIWGDPAYLFGVMNDQYQGGFPRRLLYRCRKLSNNTTEWVKTKDDELALQSNVTSALNAKQDKLTAGENITIDSDGVISAAGGEQVQADWEQDDSEDPSYIRNKPDLSDYQKALTAGEGIDLDSDGNISVDTDVIQEKLTPGDGIEIDESGVISNTFEQVQSDWAQEDAGEPDYIKNKPDMDDYQKALTAGDGIILDSDGNISVDKETIQEKLTPGDGINIDNDGVITADPQVQSDWEEDDVDSPAYIQNKPDLSEYQKELTAGEGITIVNNIISVDSDSVQEKLTPGEGINIDSNGVITAEGKRYTEGWGIDIDDEHDVISVDPDIIQQKLTPGEGITIDSDGNIGLDLPPIKPLVAGDNITIVDSDNSVVISAADSTEYTAGFGIEIDGEGSISVDTSAVQEKLTAGEGVNIDSDGVITAEGRQYTEGWGIDIDENNVISVDQSIVQGKLTEGDGIEINSDGVISVDTESLPIIPLVAGNNITIEESNGSVVISADDVTVDQTYDATSSNPQSGTAVAEAVATKEDEFDAGDGLEFITDSDGNRVLQVEGPVDVVAGPGIVIDNPDGNTLRISQAYPTDETVLWETTSSGVESGSIAVSEAITNFEKYEIYGFEPERGGTFVNTFSYSSIPFDYSSLITKPNDNNGQYAISVNMLCAGNISQWRLTYFGCRCHWDNTFTQLTIDSNNGAYVNKDANGTFNGIEQKLRITKIVGIHRISGGN